MLLRVHAFQMFCACRPFFAMHATRRHDVFFAYGRRACRAVIYAIFHRGVIFPMIETMMPFERLFFFPLPFSFSSRFFERFL